jgi:hypothetical protein
MTTLEIEEMANAAVRKLRSDKLQRGVPFMINSKELPDDQCYLEYPDGRITLVTLSKNERDFQYLRDLSAAEILRIRQKYGLTAL